MHRGDADLRSGSRGENNAGKGLQARRTAASLVQPHSPVPKDTMNLQELPWLPRPPADWSQCLRALDGTADEKAAALRALASFALDDNQLGRLAKAAAAAGAGAGWRPFRLALLSSATTKLLKASLVGTAVRYGIRLEVVEGGYNQVVQETFSESSEIVCARPDGILLALDRRAIPGLEAAITSGEGDPEAAIGWLMQICERLLERTGATLFVQNVVPPTLGLFGSLEPATAASQRHRIDAFNACLAARLGTLGAVLVDIDGLARAVGYENWESPHLWHLGKIPFDHAMNPLFAEWVLRLVAARIGLSRKCLVVDCDNTLWGGVVGDDGLEGIRIGQGEPVGEAFAAVQRLVADLRTRGVIIAVCSKNDDATARRVFREHPDMILREEDIAVFQANWRDKASNLRAIAGALDISTSSLVFLDDNPAEREQMRRELPEVAVPEVGDDPTFYPSALLAAGYFEALGFTEDDRRRAGQYRASALRAELAADLHDPQAFLVSLDMEAAFAPFDATGRARVAQLIGRSNQFNLTTRRHDEAALAAFEKDPRAVTLQVRLKDRFGDNGMVSVVIGIDDGDSMVLDTWLMSCRVLNRRLEEAVLDVLVESARARGSRRIVGHFIPSGRNDLVRDHYGRMGFRKARADADLDTWSLELADYVPRNPPILRVRATPEGGVP